MRKEYLISIVLLVMLVAFSMPVSAMSSSAIINVPSDYATIQDAINVAKPGDTIRVDSGLYREHVIVNKTVSLIGAGSFSTFIDGMGTGDVVKINASCVLVKGFSIRNGSTGILIKNGSYNTIIENEITAVNFGITLYNSCYGNSIIDNKVTSCSTGIWVWYSNSNLISDNHIVDMGNNGIDIAHSDCNRIVNNTISDTDTGILTRSCIGNSLIDNYISENRYGIMTGWGTGYEANDHIVSCNTIISSTETGILMYAGKNNTFCYNAITNNAKGITTWSSGNSFYHNTIIANSVQVDPAGNVNIWHEGYPSGGNYWSDHPNPVDTNNDGICDTPYDIDMLNHDINPLCNPLPKPMPGPNVIHVPSQYPTIVDAIDAAKPGDTILVSTGVYPEHVVVNKPVSLVGAGSGVTYIDGSGTGTVVYINASNVLVKGFTIWNGTTGIAIENCSCNIVLNNQVTNNKWYGVTLSHSSGNNIIDNIIAHHLPGYPAYGIVMRHSNCNLISDNYIAHLGHYGIKICDCCCNRIVDNLITNNTYGVHLTRCMSDAILDNYMNNNYGGIDIYNSNNHIISCNTIKSNSWSGIIIHFGSSNNAICCNAITDNAIGVWIRNANDNAIYHNNFIDNPTQADTTDSINTWYEDYPSGGNYWSDHPYPVDVDNDGICDVPYDITMLQKDIFPLCNPLPKPLKTFFVAHFMTPEGEPYPFDVMISDGIWREEWKNVIYIMTEVPCNATYTFRYQRDGETLYRTRLSLSPGELREFDFYALDPQVEATRSLDDGIYIMFQERGADASLSWEWDPAILTLSWNLTCNPGQYVGVGMGIDDNITEPPNYAIGVIDPDLLPFLSSFPIHFPPGECVIASDFLVVIETGSQSSKVRAEQIDPALGTITIANAIYNDAVGPVNITLKDLNGTEYPQQYPIPQYAVSPGNYICVPSTDPMIASIVNGIPCKVKPGKGVLFDISLPKIADLVPYTFSIIAENAFAHSSYSNLIHAPGDSITVYVSTETNYDWWGCFILPDTVTVAAARSYDGLVWSDLDELYDYTINPIDGYKIVVVRITPKTEQLLLKYSPVPIPVLAFYPPEVNIPLYSTKTVNLTLSSAPNGLSGYNLTVSLSNSGIAEILSVNFPDWAILYDNAKLPSDSVWIKATDLNDRIKRSESNITLATLTIRGDKQGKSDVIVNVTKIDNDDGNPIYPITIPSHVNVIVPSCGITFPGCTSPPTDPDNDGLCEDTNGNGKKDFSDVSVFFNNLEWVEKNQPIECYDFNGNGHIDFNDIVKLFEEI